MSDKQKILLCGDVEGKFKRLFTKVENINKKSGPFDYLLCVGNFFGDNNTELNAYKNHEKKIPVPTFIIGPNKQPAIKDYPDLDGCEICPNLTYLGRRGLYTADSGLKIAYVSGIESSSDKTTPKELTLTETDVISVRDACLKGQPSFRGTDLLLTSQWPAEVTKFDPNEPKFKYNGSKLVSWLAAQVKPRYHISGLEGIYYERPPYRNQSKGGGSIEIASRFMALGRVGSTEKWIYALNLTPVDRTRLMDLATKTTDETQSPYPASAINSSPSASAKAENLQFFYDMKPPENTRSARPAKRQKKMEFDTAKCWFCLSSPEVSKHLVISVGNDVYLALAKGGLVDDHFLILPVSHYQSLSTVPDSVDREIEENKKAVRRYYAGTGRIPVFFERNYKSSHCQLQAVPVPEHLMPSLEEIFMGIARSEGFDLIPLQSPLKKIAPPGTTYFYVELPTGDRFYHKIVKNFPLHFGREVLANREILDLEDKIDWKDCQKDPTEETDLAVEIRKKFKPYEVSE